MSLKNRYDNVIIRNNNSIGISNYGLDYLLQLEKEIEQLKLIRSTCAFCPYYTKNKKYKEVIDKANNKLNSFIECCKAEKIESGSDYLHHSYWDMFERFNKQIKDILKEVK